MASTDLALCEPTVRTCADVGRTLEDLADTHRRYADRAPDTAVSLEERFGHLAPRRLDTAFGTDPLAAHVVIGWERFFCVVDDETASGIAALHAHPEPLVGVLGEGSQTLLRLLPVGLLLPGWVPGSAGPAALDLAALLIRGVQRTPARGVVIARFRDLEPEVDERSLVTALLAGLVEMGWSKALAATGHPDRAIREHEAADLGWWVDRAREGLALVG